MVRYGNVTCVKKLMVVSLVYRMWPEI